MATELIVARSPFTGEARERFPAALGDDDATRARCSGWPPSTAVIALPYNRDSNPALVAASRRTIGEGLGALGSAWD